MEEKTKLYTMSATSTGGRNGHVRSDDGFLDLDLKSPAATGGPGGGTNPEALFAAGYSACYNGAVWLAARLSRIKTGEVAVTASVTLNSDGDNRFIFSVKLQVVIPGVEQSVAEKLAQQAHTICPFSRSTHGNIEVETVVTTE